MSVSAAAVPPWSIFHAACSVISRAAVISAAEAAIQSCTICLSASSEPCAYRDRARSQSMSNARLDCPSQRMQWWMRPGPSRCWASRKPSPSLPMRFSAGIRTSR